MAHQCMQGVASSLIPYNLSLFEVISQPIGDRELACSKFIELMNLSSEFAKIDDRLFSTDLSQFALFQKLNPNLDVSISKCTHGESVGIKSYKQIQLYISENKQNERPSWIHSNVRALLCTVNYQMQNSNDFIQVRGMHTFDTLLCNDDIEQFISEIAK
jgi:hypothetical protein